MKNISIAILLGIVLSSPAWGEHPQDFVNAFSAQAKIDDPGFSGCDAKRGEQFFKSRHGGDWSCSTCHTEDPTAKGKHVVTKKILEPLAPAANPSRFTNPAKVKKWFKRNCKDLLERECTAREKGDVLTYLMSLGH